MPVLNKHGLFLSQATRVEDGQNVLVTRISHANGMEFKSEMLLKPVKNDPQAEGSAMSYARRHSICGLLCLGTEDDDGEGAMDRKSAKELSRNPIVAKAEEVFKAEKGVIIPSCKVCGKDLKKSIPHGKWYCENFKDRSNGEHTTLNIGDE